MMNYGDEEEQRPLTTADIRALLNEQDARHKEEIHALLNEQEERINAAHQEEIRLQEERINAAYQEEIRAHKEQIHLLEEATDKRFKDLEEASASSSPPPQDAANNTAGATQSNDETLPLTNNQGTSNTQLTPNRPRRGFSAILSLLFFQRGRNEESDSDHDDEAGNDNDRYEVLEEDTFSLMMLNKPFREIPCCHPVLLMIILIVGFLGIISHFFRGFPYIENYTWYWSLFAAFTVMIFGPLSSPWILSMFIFLWLQLALGLLIIADQTLSQSDVECPFGVPCDVPLVTYPGLTVAQYLTVFFTFATKNDIFSSLQTVSKLRNADNVPWDVVIGQPGNRTWSLWICRILVPNVFKFIQAVIILYATFIVIIQCTSIVDLLKDFTALLVVSEADNIIFHRVNLGYFGEYLMKKTEEVKAVRWMIAKDATEEGDTDEDEGKKNNCWCSCNMGSCIIFTLAMAMIGGLTYVVMGQYNGNFLKKIYPRCNVLYPFAIGDGVCSDFPPYNTAECGWDGGDCPEPSDVNGYNNCAVSFPDKIGDGQCHFWPPYDTAECGWDGGDCFF